MVCNAVIMLLAGDELPFYDHSAERQGICLLRKESDKTLEHRRKDAEGYPSKFSHYRAELRSQWPRIETNLAHSIHVCL